MVKRNKAIMQNSKLLIKSNLLFLLKTIRNLDNRQIDVSLFIRD